MFSEPLWEVGGQQGFGVLRGQFSLKGPETKHLNILSNADMQSEPASKSKFCVCLHF